MPYVPFRVRERIREIIQRQAVPISDLLGLPRFDIGNLKLVIDDIPDVFDHAAEQSFGYGHAWNRPVIRFDADALKDYYSSSYEALEGLVVHELAHAIIGSRDGRVSPARSNYRDLSSSFEEGMADWVSHTLVSQWEGFDPGGDRYFPTHAQRETFRPIRDKYGSMALFLETKNRQFPGLVQTIAKTLNTTYGHLPETWKAVTGEPLRDSVQRYRNPTPAPERREARARTARLVREGL